MAGGDFNQKPIETITITKRDGRGEIVEVTVIDVAAEVAAMRQGR